MEPREVDGAAEGGGSARPFVVRRRRNCQAWGGTGGGATDVGDQDDGLRGK